MTTVSSILSVGLLPANLLLYSYLAYGTGHDESVLEALDFKTLFITLGIVLSAILTGLLAGYRYDSPQFHVAANRFGSVCGLLLIVFSVFLSSGGGGSDSTFWSMEWSFYLAVAFPCLVGMSLANIISRAVNLSPPETVAIAIECCYQNTGIATSVAITMFDDKDERAQAVAVPLFYGVVEAVAIGLYCVCAWKWGWTKAPPDERLCVILGKTYEVEMDGLERTPQGQDPESGDVQEGDNDQGDERGKQEQEQTDVRLGLFPRLVRFFFGSREVSSSVPSRENQCDDDEKRHKENHGNRNRMVSADYTAETSQCSSVAPMTPESPVGHHNSTGDQVIFSTAALTIPEAPSEASEFSES